MIEGKERMFNKSFNKDLVNQVIARQSRLIDPDNNELVIVARRRFPFEEWICHQAISLKLDLTTGYVKDRGYSRMPVRALASEADSDYRKLLSKFSSYGYKSASVTGILRPLNLCSANWDTEVDLPVGMSCFCRNAIEAGLKIKSQATKEAQAANPVSSWYSGAIPDPQSLAGYVGTPSVDASQISSFNGVQEAIQLVNQFDSSLLKSVAFIFNTSGGAYGVYVPWIDEQIKNAEVKEWLKREGFEVDDKDANFFTAYSKDPKIKDTDIKQEIERLRAQARMQGGNTFGINMAKIMAAAQADANESGMNGQDDLRDITILHLGATMVHEAVHAKGSQSEGPSEQAEMAFTQWALPILNKKRFARMQNSGEQAEFAPLVVNPGVRRSAGWYNEEVSKKIERTAQFGAQFSLSNPTTTSLAPWAGLLWSSGVDAIESMLQMRREGPKPGKPYEKRLREQSRTTPKVDTSEVAAMLLEKDHDGMSGYLSIEDMLEERRPKPLAIMIDKAATSAGMTKTAFSDESYNSTFGWMNNLDLPMSERMIEDEQSSDFLNFDWEGMKKLPRYNPEYERSGVYYTWVEPRQNAPELWDRMISERSAVSPAARFAQEDVKDIEIAKILDVLETAKDLTLEGKIAGTRFLCGEGILPWMDKFYSSSSGIAIYKFPVISESNGDKISPIWLVRDVIPEKAVAVAEAFASGHTDEPKASDVFEHITGLSKQRKQVIDFILQEATKVASELGMKEAFVVGAFPRAIMSEESWVNVSDLDFVCAFPKDCLKYGSILAERLKASPKMMRRTSTLTWKYKGVECNFRGKWTPQAAAELMAEQGIEQTPVNLEVYSRDFTVNMFAYKIFDGNVYDITGQGAKDMQAGRIRTYFNADQVVQANSISILKAIKFACKYRFEIADDLKKAMLSNTNLLFKQYDQSRLSSALREIMKEGLDKARLVIAEYGLESLFDIENQEEARK
jgi:hypothetical protein